MATMLPRKIDISHKTIFFTAAFLALLWVLYIILDLILLLFVSVIFVSAFSPVVDRLTKWGLPKVVSILLIYLLVVLILSAMITLGLTSITLQTANLAQRLSEAVNSLLASNHLDTSILQQHLPDLSRNIVSVTLDIFRSLIAGILVAVITFYLLLDKEKLEGHFASLFTNKKDKVLSLLKQIEIKLGAWLRGQVLLSVIVAVLIYLGLTILGVDFALPLAVISGLFEVIPFIGPILGAIPGILIALVSSPVLALLTALLYLVVQQLESHVIVPQLMKKAVGLNPLVVILAIAIGSRVLGVAGALLAVPFAVVVQIITEDYFKG